MLDLLIVTGASRGIGASVLANCAIFSKGILAIGSSTDILKCEAAHQNCRSLRLDLANLGSVKSELASALKDLRRDACVGVALCAAQVGSPGGLTGGDLEDWDRVFRCNVLGNLGVLQSVLKSIGHEGSLRVVFFAGGGAAYGYPEFSAYALSKVAVVRAVENLGMEFAADKRNASIIALAPGAVATDMLATVIANGGIVKTRTDISEPTNFVKKFLLDELPSTELNGRFVHVRDNVTELDFEALGPNHFKLRRVE